MQVHCAVGQQVEVQKWRRFGVDVDLRDAGGRLADQHAGGQSAEQGREPIEMWGIHVYELQ